MSKYRIDQPDEYVDYLENWMDSLQPEHISEIAKNPAASAVISVDMIKGFCSIGPLASPRVSAIIQPIVELLNLAWGHRIRSIVFLQDSHEPDALEFGSFPPHCVRGTEEAETVDEFKSLPFFNQINIMEKNSLSSALHTGLNTWLTGHPEVNTFFVVGNCTDLCTYQLAMHLRMDANARQVSRRVILPINCVDTYDLPIEEAQKIHAIPHPASFVHTVFLHNMLLNGIEVYSCITK